MRARDYDYGGGRNLMPAYGAVLSLAYADGLTKHEFLNCAQIFNVNMSIILLLGLFVPVGMRLAAETASAETPWYWALNGIFGVLCSALAVLISIYVGISTNFYLAAACYTAVVVAQAGFQRPHPVVQPLLLPRRHVTALSSPGQ